MDIEDNKLRTLKQIPLLEMKKIIAEKKPNVLSALVKLLEDNNWCVQSYQEALIKYSIENAEPPKEKFRSYPNFGLGCDEREWYYDIFKINSKWC